MADSQATIDNLLEVKFYLHYLKFIPYAGSPLQSSSDILLKILTFLNQEHLAGRGYSIDRNKSRPELEKRELFMNNPVRIPIEKRFKCSIALLKDKDVMVKKADTFELIPYNKAVGLIAYQTHFFIDYSVYPAIICAEFNNDGPRISDIEYYLRNLASEKDAAKGCQITTCFYAPIDDTLKQLHNVLNFEMKLRPQSIEQLDVDMRGNFIEYFKNIGDKLKPQFIRIEAMYQTPGAKKIKSKLLNKEANSLIRSFLKKLSDKPEQIEQFEEFEVKFEDNEGKDFVFNLIKGKREILVKVDRKTRMTTSKFYDLVKEEFNKFVKSNNHE
jgi:hypothetical protein